jgi:NAD(P)-dependent dehydrogenase (short-subunit alcohol dehydrogenase family)
MPQVWLITGSSRGLGRAFAEAALDAGDFVSATARNVGDLADLKPKYGSRVFPLWPGRDKRVAGAGGGA